MLNLSLTLAVIKKLRTIEQGQSGGGGDTLPEIGSTIEGFHTTTTDGETIDAAALAHGRRQIFVVSPGCEPCRDLIARLVDDPALAEPGAVALVVGADEDSRALAATLPSGLKVGLDRDEVHMDVLSVGAYPAVLTLVDGKVTAASHGLPKRARARSAA
ncbi:hypothetical protein Pen01_14370 [Phytomonospora endophytica]|nr:hypothetical protein Pen01_14370 [Phytomonospora endophytica]